MNVNRYLSILLVGMLLLSGMNVSAQTNHYQIEIILFEHLQLGDDNETWPRQSERPDWQNAIRLDNGREGYPLLPAGRQRMQGIQRVLRSAGEYRPVLHVTWQQPGLIEARAQPVLLPAGSDQVEGTVLLRRSRYLHVDLDLIYALGSGADHFARLQESRRVRLNELHYFDHPLFGAIVQVTRAE